ncbi:SHOCT domain-containing protein [Frondihabitans sp. PAMC 28766]|uniref:SHOCT domain-containing protein n=1 Tax=Frondihabitans sp. PAMC 28766 TaxID=1795630 RepID=UPI001EF68EBC|nr:hypothetical protein [Frondihabitans sp. PAMC 28766]
MTAALASLPLVQHAIGPWGDGGGYGPGFGHVGFPWPLVFIPVFWLAVIVVVGLVFGRRFRRAAASRAQFGPHGFGPGAGFGPWGHGGWGAAVGTGSAEQVLSDRFARGDIDEVEYRARLEVLRASQQGPGPVA